MAQTKKIITVLLVVFVLYTVITSPVRASDLVRTGFVGISDAARAVGTFMTNLVK